MVLTAALGAVGGELAAGHGHKRPGGSLDDLQVADDEAVVQRDRTNACKRSPGSSMSLMRTSVISTAVLLTIRRWSKQLATARRFLRASPANVWPGAGPGPRVGKLHTTPNRCHSWNIPQVEACQLVPQPFHPRRQRRRRRRKPVQQQVAHPPRVAPLQGLDQRSGLQRALGRTAGPVDLGGPQSHRGTKPPRNPFDRLPLTGSIFSPRPRQTAGPRPKKNGMSLPNSAPAEESSACD